MPLAYFRDVKIEQQGSRTIVSWRQSEVDRMGQRGPVKDSRLQVRTRYVFEPGLITRTDVYTTEQPLPLKSLAVEMGSFSGAPRTRGQATRFSGGSLSEFAVTGYERCESAGALDDARYRTSNGAFASRVSCTRGAFTLKEPLTLSWRLRYAPVP
jgi:hypothetical protein